MKGLFPLHSAGFASSPDGKTEAGEVEVGPCSACRMKSTGPWEVPGGTCGVDQSLVLESQDPRGEMQEGWPLTDEVMLVQAPTGDGGLALGEKGHPLPQGHTAWAPSRRNQCLGLSSIMFPLPRSLPASFKLFQSCLIQPGRGHVIPQWLLFPLTSAHQHLPLLTVRASSRETGCLHSPHQDRDWSWAF